MQITSHCLIHWWLEHLTLLHHFGNNVDIGAHQNLLHHNIASHTLLLIADKLYLGIENKLYNSLTQAYTLVYILSLQGYAKCSIMLHCILL